MTKQQNKNLQTQSPNQTQNAAVSQAGPRTWEVRWTNGEMMSGVGVMAAALMVLVVVFMGYLPVFDGQVPFAANVILWVIGLPTFGYLSFIGLRRLRWEHRNGGLLRNSLSGGGIVLAIFVVAIILTLFIYR